MKTFSLRTNYREHTGGTKAYRTFRLAFGDTHIIVGQYGAIDKIKNDTTGGQFDIKYVGRSAVDAAGEESKIVKQKMRGKSDGTYTKNVVIAEGEEADRNLFAVLEQKPMSGNYILEHIFGASQTSNMVGWSPLIAELRTEKFQAEGSDFATPLLPPEPEVPVVRSKEWGTW
jgi:hypothetical protein